MDGTADQADRRHFRAVSDAVPVPAVTFVQLLCYFPVEHFHSRPSRLRTPGDATFLPLYLSPDGQRGKGVCHNKIFWHINKQGTGCVSRKAA